jgi:putative SOS response-associated peptidase YedK
LSADRWASFVHKKFELNPKSPLASAPGKQFCSVLNRFRSRETLSPSPVLGNLPPMPGVFPDYPAPVVRNAGTERELVMMRWGMPPPPRTGGPPVTTIHNTSSPHWR